MRTAIARLRKRMRRFGRCRGHMKSRILQAAAAAVCVYLGLMLGWYIWHPRPQPGEGEALARTLPKSGAQVLARDPSTPVSQPIKAAIKESGGKAERIVHLTITPKPIPAPDTAAPSALHPPEAEKPESPAPGCSCSPVDIDLALVRMPDQTRRVLALGANGEQIAGVDIPIESARAPRVLHWAAGASYDAKQREYGAFVDRDLGPLRLGVEVQQRAGGAAVLMRAGIRF